MSLHIHMLHPHSAVAKSYWIYLSILMAITIIQTLVSSSVDAEVTSPPAAFPQFCRVLNSGPHCSIRVVPRFWFQGSHRILAQTRYLIFGALPIPSSSASCPHSYPPPTAHCSCWEPLVGPPPPRMLSFSTKVCPCTCCSFCLENHSPFASLANFVILWSSAKDSTPQGNNGSPCG